MAIQRQCIISFSALLGQLQILLMLLIASSS
jgi:hypothetical protein